MIEYNLKESHSKYIDKHLSLSGKGRNHSQNSVNGSFFSLPDDYANAWRGKSSEICTIIFKALIFTLFTMCVLFVQMIYIKEDLKLLIGPMDNLPTDQKTLVQIKSLTRTTVLKKENGLKGKLSFKVLKD